MRVGSRTLILLGMAAWHTSGPASARAEFTPLQVRSVSMRDTNWSMPTPELVPFQKFDPSTGDLKSVLLTVNFDSTSNIDMTFVTPSAITVWATAALSLLRPDGSTLFSASPIFVNGLTVPSSTPQSLSFPKTTSGTSGTIVLTDPADLALFTGPGTISLPLITIARSGFSTTSGNGFGEARTQVSAVVTLQFEVVPEPSALVLFGLGGIGLVLFRPLRRSLLIRQGSAVT